MPLSFRNEIIHLVISLCYGIKPASLPFVVLLKIPTYLEKPFYGSQLFILLMMVSKTDLNFFSSIE